MTLKATMFFEGISVGDFGESHQLSFRGAIVSSSSSITDISSVTVTDISDVVARRHLLEEDASAGYKTLSLKDQTEEATGFVEPPSLEKIDTHVAGTPADPAVKFTVSTTMRKLLSDSISIDFEILIVVEGTGADALALVESLVDSIEGELAEALESSDGTSLFMAFFEAEAAAIGIDVSGLTLDYEATLASINTMSETATFIFASVPTALPTSIPTARPSSSNPTVPDAGGGGGPAPAPAEDNVGLYAGVGAGAGLLFAAIFGYWYYLKKKRNLVRIHTTTDPSKDKKKGSVHPLSEPLLSGSGTKIAPNNVDASLYDENETVDRASSLRTMLGVRAMGKLKQNQVLPGSAEEYAEGKEARKQSPRNPNQVVPGTAEEYAESQKGGGPKQPPRRTNQVVPATQEEYAEGKEGGMQLPTPSSMVFPGTEEEDGEGIVSPLHPEEGEGEKKKGVRPGKGHSPIYPELSAPELESVEPVEEVKEGRDIFAQRIFPNENDVPSERSVSPASPDLYSSLDEDTKRNPDVGRVYPMQEEKGGDAQEVPGLGGFSRPRIHPNEPKPKGLGLRDILKKKNDRAPRETQRQQDSP